MSAKPQNLLIGAGVIVLAYYLLRKRHNAAHGAGATVNTSTSSNGSDWSYGPDLVGGSMFNPKFSAIDLSSSNLPANWLLNP